VSSNPAQARYIRYNIMWKSFSVTCDRSVVFLRVSSTNKTDRHDITEILLKVALNTIALTPNPNLITIIHILNIFSIFDEFFHPDFLYKLHVSQGTTSLKFVNSLCKKIYHKLALHKLWLLHNFKIILNNNFITINQFNGLSTFYNPFIYFL
jgi:hypothetical protein